MENVLEGFNIDGDFFDEVNKLCIATEEKRNRERNMSHEERGKKGSAYVQRRYGGSISDEQLFREDVQSTNNSWLLSCLMNINEIRKRGNEKNAFDVLIKWVKEYMKKTYFEEDPEIKHKRCLAGAQILGDFNRIMSEILFGFNKDLILFLKDGKKI